MDNKYLTYEEYVNMGGTLEQMPFNLLELTARQKINARTQNRLSQVNEYPIEVKACMYKLIEILNSYNGNSGNISSENIDGYSVSYRADTSLQQNMQVEDTINTYLAYVVVNNTPILYLGV